MKLKSYLVGIVFSVFSFALVRVTNAAWVWDPMVEIPGIPTTGVTLSTYLVGLYGFLLSIVGIVAVMMLIVGGMRLITAAGNSAALSSGKEIISNAFWGLLLALLSWVFISTINPDALYLKKPGSGFTSAIVNTAVGPTSGGCFTSYDPTIISPSKNCICGDGTEIISTDVTDCISDCESAGFCNILLDSCTRKAEASQVFTVDTKCFCNDGFDWDTDNNYKKPDSDWFENPLVPPENKNCDYLCSHAVAAEDEMYHGAKLTIMVSKNAGMQGAFEFIDGSSLDTDTTYYFDLSRSRDCLYGIATYALELVGGEPEWGLAIDRGCCEKNYNCDLLSNPGLACGIVLLQCRKPGPIFSLKTPTREASSAEIFWIGSYLNNSTDCNIAVERTINYSLVLPLTS